jgi:nucleotide-binding universal stress UspA family protein
MINSKHWLIAIDLTKMDEVLVGYTAFLASIVKPETITFLHVIESGPTALDIIEQFPELESKEEFEKIIRDEINELVNTHIDRETFEVRTVIKEGRATDNIIDVVNSLEPDLLLMGKKVGFVGEGVIPKQILKYVSSSILFVPENCRYSLKKALVPVDFSEQSAKGISTALDLVKSADGEVIAQHIYQYRAQFFPYMLSEEEKKKVDREIETKKDNFIGEFDIPSRVNFKISRHANGKIADTVYSEVISQQSDILIVASKVKKLPKLMRYNFTDKMVNYAFGIPLLIQKNKERHQKFLKSILDLS